MTLRFEVNTLQHYARLLGNKFMKEKKIITYTWFHRYFHRKYFTIYLVTDLNLFNVSLKNDIHFLLFCILTNSNEKYHTEIGVEIYRATVYFCGLTDMIFPLLVHVPQVYICSSETMTLTRQVQKKYNQLHFNNFTFSLICIILYMVW